MRKKIEDFANANEIEIVFAEGYDDCIIGLGQSFTCFKVIYDRKKIITRLMQDMDLEDAEEYFDYNISGAYVGESTPMFTLQI